MAVAGGSADQIVQLASDKYVGFNDIHLTEKLVAEEGLGDQPRDGAARVARRGREIAAEAAAAEVPLPARKKVPPGHDGAHRRQPRGVVRRTQTVADFDWLSNGQLVVWHEQQRLYELEWPLDYTSGQAPQRPRAAKPKLPKIYSYAGRPALAVRP